MAKSIDDWLEQIAQAHPKEIELGLDRTHSVFSRLITRCKIDRIAKNVVVVAGTNGKGSTVAMIEAIAMQNGIRVGAYTSPHISKYNERVRVNGASLSDEDIVSGFEMVESTRGDTPLTYFEFGTLAALYSLYQSDLDLVLLEVGLGGRLDAVNVVDADVAIVTSIALDHEDWLGSDLEQIGREKAGVFRKEMPVVLGKDITASVVSAAIEMECDIYAYGSSFGSEGQGVYFETGEQSRRYSLVSNVASFLPLSNRLVAVQACSLLSCFSRVLGFEQKQIWQDCFDVVSSCQVSGRIERVDCENVTKDGLQYPQIYLDVGHNPHAAAHLSEVFRSLLESGTRIIAVYSSLDDKDVQGILRTLDEFVDRWFVGELANERAMKRDRLQDIFLQSDIELTCHASFGEALTSACDFGVSSIRSGRDTVLFVFGSFYVVEEAKAWLKND